MDEASLIAAIRAAPDDDRPRLVYADWLSERGDPRGELILVDCREAAMAPDDPARPGLTARLRELVAEHDAREPLASLVARSWTRRGFVDEVEVELGTFLARAAELFAAAPLLRRVLLAGEIHRSRAGEWCRGIGAGGAGRLAVTPELARVEDLWLWIDPGEEYPLVEGTIGAEGARALAASPHLGRLASLRLDWNDIGDEGAMALAGSPHLGSLRSLGLVNNRIGAAGALALARSPSLPALTTIHLGNENFTYRRDRSDAWANHIDEATAAVLRARFAVVTVGEDD